ITDLLIFDAPSASIDHLDLELPASEFGGTGQLRLRLTKSLLLFVNGRFLGTSVIPEYRRALADKNQIIRAAACAALERLGPAAADALPEIAEALSDKEPAVRQAAAQALGRIGTRAKAALPSLLKTLADRDEQVSLASAQTLGQVGPFGRADISALT